VSRALFASLVVLAGCAAADGTDSATSALESGTEASSLRAANVNGGTTGAMVRATTNAGYTCAKGTWTLPDADTTKPGEPWVYYGVGDEAGVDMEAGMAFQEGDGTAALPHRWIPYLRQGNIFVFGDESTRVLPGTTFALEVRLDGGRVSLWRDGQRTTFAKHPPAIDSLPLALDAKKAHIRRVVGSAISTRYDGETLGTFGPVVFQSTTLCTASGGTASFHDNSHWSESRRGVLFGSVAFPASGITHLYEKTRDEDTISLFP